MTMHDITQFELIHPVVNLQIINNPGSFYCSGSFLHYEKVTLRSFIRWRHPYFVGLFASQFHGLDQTLHIKSAPNLNDNVYEPRATRAKSLNLLTQVRQV